MARKESDFDMFGINYRTKQFNAVYGLELMDSPVDMTPLQILCDTEVEFNGEWIKLNSAERINLYVKDLANLITPVSVLGSLMGIVSTLNFGFMIDWRGVKVPRQFMSDAKTVETVNSKPLVAQLQQQGTASLRELEEYYSTEDAFKMFDVNVAKGVSEAYANMAAQRAAKR